MDIKILKIENKKNTAVPSSTSRWLDNFDFLQGNKIWLYSSYYDFYVKVYDENFNQIQQKHKRMPTAGSGTYNYNGWYNPQSRSFYTIFLGLTDSYNTCVNDVLIKIPLLDDGTVGEITTSKIYTNYPARNLYMFKNGEWLLVPFDGSSSSTPFMYSENISDLENDRSDWTFVLPNQLFKKNQGIPITYLDKNNFYKIKYINIDKENTMHIVDLKERTIQNYPLPDLIWDETVSFSLNGFFKEFTLELNDPILFFYNKDTNEYTKTITVKTAVIYSNTTSDSNSVLHGYIVFLEDYNYDLYNADTRSKTPLNMKYKSFPIAKAIFRENVYYQEYNFSEYKPYFYPQEKIITKYDSATNSIQILSSILLNVNEDATFSVDFEYKGNVPLVNTYQAPAIFTTLDPFPAIIVRDTAYNTINMEAIALSGSSLYYQDINAEYGNNFRHAALQAIYDQNWELQYFIDQATYNNSAEYSYYRFKFNRLALTELNIKDIFANVQLLGLKRNKNILANVASFDDNLSLFINSNVFLTNNISKKELNSFINRKTKTSPLFLKSFVNYLENQKKATIEMYVATDRKTDYTLLINASDKILSNLTYKNRQIKTLKPHECIKVLGRLQKLEKELAKDNLVRHIYLEDRKKYTYNPDGLVDIQYMRDYAPILNDSRDSKEIAYDKDMPSALFEE